MGNKDGCQDHKTEMVQALISKLVAQNSIRAQSQERVGRGTKVVIGHWGINQGPFWPNTLRELGYLHGVMEGP